MCAVRPIVLVRFVWLLAAVCWFFQVTSGQAGDRSLGVLDIGTTRQAFADSAVVAETAGIGRTFYAFPPLWPLPDTGNELSRHAFDSTSATWQRREFVALTANSERGSLLTNLLRTDAEELLIDARTSPGGSLRVALQDAHGRLIPGFGLEDCVPIQGDSTRHLVRWRGASKLPAAVLGDPIRLVITVSQGEAFSFRFAKRFDRNLATDELPDYVSWAYQLRDASMVSEVVSYHRDKLAALPPNACDRIAREASQHLRIDDVWRESQWPESWFLYIRDEAAPAVRARNYLNEQSAGLLSFLAARRLVHDPTVVRGIIEALDHPSPQVRRQLFYALRSLTGRNVGESVWGRGITRIEQERKLRGWWQDWWIENRDYQLVYDDHLRRLVEERTERVARAIDSQLSDRFPELSRMGIAEAKSLRAHPMVRYGEPFALVYEPRLLANFSLGSRATRVRWEDLPWLAIEGVFATPASGDEGQRDFGSPSPPGNVQTIHWSRIGNTNVMLRVRLQTSNEHLRQAMKELLAEFCILQFPLLINHSGCGEHADLLSRSHRGHNVDDGPRRGVGWLVGQ